MNHDINDVRRKIIEFRDRRDWQQFHNPKNLAEAISIESGELLETFLWKTADDSRSLDEAGLQAVKEELADIFIFMIYMCDELNIDLLEETTKKIAKNTEKYPIKKAKGKHLKYNKL